MVEYYGVRGVTVTPSKEVVLNISSATFIFTISQNYDLLVIYCFHSNLSKKRLNVLYIHTALRVLRVVVIYYLFCLLTI